MNETIITLEIVTNTEDSEEPEEISEALNDEESDISTPVYFKKCNKFSREVNWLKEYQKNQILIVQKLLKGRADW